MKPTFTSTLLLAILSCAGLAAPAVADPSVDTTIPWPKADPAAVAHWQSLRFGMFIHWGPVSLTGQELSWSRGSQVPVKDYDNLYKRFNPVKFNADEWVSIAKAAGMKYIVLTCKHHDGFCLWDTKLTDYNIMNTPFKRDVVKELAEACKKQGIAFGAYYSVTDWYNPNWPTTSAGGAFKAKYDFDAYQKYLLGQTEELIKNYGPLITLWNDASSGNLDGYGKHGAYTLKLARELQPDILINNRTAAGGDYDTPEQEIGRFQLNRPWESCMTVSAHNHWAWAGEKDGVKTAAECLKMVIVGAAGDGNVLLNVGPRPDGVIDPAQASVLKEVGDWLAKNGASIYGTRGGPWRQTASTASTRKGQLVYLHILKWPEGMVTLPNLPAKIISAKTLGGAQAIARQAADGIQVFVAPADRDANDTVVVLELDSDAMKIPALAGGSHGAAANQAGATGLPKNKLTLRVGADHAGGTRFPGDMARLLVVGNRALSAEEVAKLADPKNAVWAQCDGVTAALDGRLPLALDGSQPVALGGEAQVIAADGGLDGLMYRLNGKGWLDIRHSDALNGENGLTLAAWVRLSAEPVPAARIFDKATPGVDNGYLFDTHPGNSLRGPGVGFAAKLPVGQWVHVAVTVDGVTGARVIYVNGKAVR